MNCGADDCEKPRYGKKDYCRMHYARLVRTGTVGGYKAIYNYDKICVAEGCEEKYTQVNSKLCEWHYDDYKEQIREQNRQKAYDQHEMDDWTADDYEEFWQWVKKELKLA